MLALPRGPVKVPMVTGNPWTTLSLLHVGPALLPDL